MADNEQQVGLDNPDIPMVDWKSARNKGETHVAAPVVEEKEEQEEKKEEDGKEQEEEKAKPKVKGGFQVKIDRLTKMNAELEKAKDAAERRATELEAKAAKGEDKPKSADDEPKIEDFQTTEEFYRAQGRWAVRQEIKEQKEAELRAQEEAETREIFDAHNKTISEARAKYDDFDEVINATATPWKDGSKADIAASQSFHIAVVESGIGAEILYHYAKHPEELNKLHGLTPAKVQMAIGRLTDKLEAKSEEPEEKETPKKKAAAEEEDEEEKPKKVPVKPISGTAKSDVELTEMSLRDYKKARNAGRVR